MTCVYVYCNSRSRYYYTSPISNFSQWEIVEVFSFLLIKENNNFPRVKHTFFLVLHNITEWVDCQLLQNEQTCVKSGRGDLSLDFHCVCFWERGGILSFRDCSGAKRFASMHDKPCMRKCRDTLTEHLLLFLVVFSKTFCQKWFFQHNFNSKEYRQFGHGFAGPL